MDDAVWPVLLVDSNCIIRHANLAAIHAFGLGMEPGSTSFTALWPSKISPAELIATLERSPAGRITLNTADGCMSLSFQAAFTGVAAGGEALLLAQLLPDPQPATPTAAPVRALETGTAHKQKLECALQLARTVALDFNNALTSILGHTSLVLSKMEPGNPWRTSLVEVEKSASKAAEIAHDLATFSRQEKEVAAQTAGNVNTLLQRNVDMFQASPIPREKQVTWSLQLERRIYGARFDEAKMQQAFLKVLENAVESLGPEGRVVVRTRNLDLTEPTQDRNAQLAAGAYVCVEITDSGCGIEPEVMPRIFEPFFTTKRGTKHRGLGLAWVYGIVTNHGGAVALSSQPGAGTSVRIYLPADKKFVKEGRVPGGDLTGNQTILLVDDEDLLLTMGQTILSAYGYRVLTASGGHQALEILTKSADPIDLMITDLVMPGMSGRELVEQVRTLLPHTRILCSSGYVQAAAPGREEEDYLQKPFSSQDLLLKVKQVLAPVETASVD